MKSIFRKWMSGLLLIATAGLGGCSDDPDGVNNELVLDRALMPLNFTASVLTTGNQVRLTWDVRTTDAYEVVIYTDEGLTQVVKTLSGIAPADVPVTVELEVEKDYYATVQAFSPNERTAPSNVAIAGPVTTYAIMDPLNPVVAERTSTSVTLTWDQDDYVSHLLATPVATAGAEPVRLDLSDDQIAEARATVSGLTPSTEYFVAVYYNSASRGGQDVWTRPDLSSTTKISTIEQLMQAFVDGGKYELAYSETPYVVPEYAEGEVNPASALAADLTIIGETTLEGDKPQIVGLGIGLNPGVNEILLEDLSIDGAEAASSLLEVTDAITMASVTVKNCDLKSFRNIFYENKAGSAIQTLLFDGIYAAGMGNSGGDFIDFRTQSTHGSLTICNSTFYNGGRSFLRVDANETFSTIAVRNNTFGSFSVVTDGNNKGILYVRGTAPTFEYTNNLFLNETGENARFIANNNSVKLPTSIAANYFFNCADTFFEAKTADGEVTLETALQNGGKVLTEDPCQKSASGKFYLVNDEIASVRVGDPRWWNAEAPVVPEQTELIALEEATTWKLTDTEIFEPQTIESNKILGNLQFLVNDAEAPMAVTDGGTISFSAASTLSPVDIPTNNALAIRVATAGSLVLTPSNAGIGTQIEIIAGADRYTIPCDGVEHTVALGEITGDTYVYITTTGSVELSALAWTTETSVDGDQKTLATPAVTISAETVACGVAQEVTLTWESVANAATYEVTWNGLEPESITATTWTIPAETVGALPAGTYPIEVVAKPVATSTKYKASEVATVAFEVKKTPLAAPQVTVTPSTVNVGEQQAVVIEWPAIEGASSYDVTYNNITTNQPGTTLALTGDVVAALAAGRYEITVVAKPTDTEHYVDSEPGAGELQIYDPAAGSGTAYSWGAADFEAIKAGFGSIDEVNSGALASMTETSDLKKNADGFTYKGLEFLLGGGKFKFAENTNADGVKAMRFQFGGSGSLTKQCVSFTVDAAGTLVVEAASSSSSEVRPLVVNIDGVEQSQDTGSSAVRYTFDGSAAQAGSKVAIYSDNKGINVFSITWTPDQAAQGDPITTTLTKTAILAANPSLPEGSSSVTGPVQWSFEGVNYESAMAAGKTSGIDVLYFYGDGKTAAGVNYLKTTSSVGTISRIKIVMQSWKTATKFTMYETVNGVKQPVTPVSDEGAMTHEFVFSEGNDGTFDFQGGPDDLKLLSFEIVYTE